MPNNVYAPSEAMRLTCAYTRPLGFTKKEKKRKTLAEKSEQKRREIRFPFRRIREEFLAAKIGEIEKAAAIPFPCLQKVIFFVENEKATLEIGGRNKELKQIKTSFTASFLLTI